MTNRKHVRSILLITLLTMFCGNALGQNVGAVRNLESTTHHDPLRPFQETQIRMTWDYPEGEPYGYYVLFDRNPEHTFDELNTMDMYLLPMNTRNFSSNGLAEDRPDDVAFYFHIAAIDNDDEIGPTATAGPFRIDVVPPSDVSVTGPETTSSRTVTLSLKATGATAMHLSDTENDDSRAYELFEESKVWTLTRGGGEKTVYVSLTDDAFNETSASVTITYVTGDADGDGLIGLRDAILILRMLSGMPAEDLNPDADTDADGRIGIREAVHVLREIGN